MFDYEAHRRLQSGVNPDKGLIVTFRYEYSDKLKKEVPYTTIFLSKNNTVDRPTTAEDKLRFKDHWDAFEKGETAPLQGLPIKQIPFATPAEISICKAERIYTAEQLVETPDSLLQRANLLNFRYRVADMLKQMTDSQHIVKMRDEIETLKKHIKVLQETNAKLKSGEEQEVKPRRGRPPRKVTDDDTDADQAVQQAMGAGR